MKKLTVLATVLMCMAATQVHAADWRLFETDKENNTYHYDRSSIKKLKGGKGRWAWVKFTIAPGYHRTLNNGTKYDSSKSQWVFSCDGTSRIDDEYYYYNGSVVYSNTGIGKTISIIPDTLAADLERRICPD